MSAEPVTLARRAQKAEAAPPRWPAHRPWPTLRPEALHGLAGDFVRLVEPQSEADPAALLVQFLTMYGCAAGLSPHMRADGIPHRGRLYALIVGTTFAGKKGTSLAHVQNLFTIACPEWAKRGRVRGLASGEGLISHFCTESDVKETTDPPDVVEKRAVFVASEFVRVLGVCSRDGSILGSVLRDLWDGERIEDARSKGTRAADDCHLAIVGHITPGELLEKLDKTDVVNGFLNRFLLICSERKRLLPDGGGLEDCDLLPIARLLTTAVEFAQTIGRMKRTEEARKLWGEFYCGQPDYGDTVIGNMLARATPHVLRLSIIYALIDGSALIRAEHLRAALAVWDYAAASVEHIFSTGSGNRIADRLLPEIRAAYPAALKRTELHAVLSGNVPAANLDAAVAHLIERGLITEATESTGRGRPTQYVRAVCKVVPMI